MEQGDQSIAGDSGSTQTRQLSGSVSAARDTENQRMPSVGVPSESSTQQSVAMWSPTECECINGSFAGRLTRLANSSSRDIRRTRSSPKLQPDCSIRSPGVHGHAFKCHMGRSFARPNEIQTQSVGRGWTSDRCGRSSRLYRWCAVVGRNDRSWYVRTRMWSRARRVGPQRSGTENLEVGSE